MLTYGKKKRSILPSFRTFRGSSRLSDARSNSIHLDPKSASCTVLPRPSEQSLRMTLHDDSIDDLASQILSDDTSFNMPAAPSIYRNPRHSRTMPQFPSLQNNTQSSRAPEINSFADVPERNERQFLGHPTNLLNNSSRDVATEEDHTAGREMPPIIPRKSSKRKSKKKGHIRRLIGGSSAPSPQLSPQRPLISRPRLIGSTSTMLLYDPLTGTSTRVCDLNPNQIITSAASAAVASNSQRGASTRSSSVEVSGQTPSSSASAAIAGNTWKGASTGSSSLDISGPAVNSSASVSGSARSGASSGSSPVFNHLMSTTILRDGQGGAATRPNARQNSGPISGRQISGPTNLKHISGRNLNSSTSASTAVNSGGGFQQTPSAMGGYHSELVSPPITGNIGLDVPAKVAAMQAYTIELKGPPPIAKPKAEVGKNIMQKAKNVISSFGKKRDTVQTPVRINQRDTKHVTDKNYPCNINPTIVWKQCDASWKDADSQLPRIGKNVNEAQSFANPKVASRCGTSIPRKPVPNDARSIRTNKSFHTEERSSSDPFSDDRQLRDSSQDENSSGDVSRNNIATVRGNDSYRHLLNNIHTRGHDNNCARSVVDDEVSTTRGFNRLGGFVIPDTTSARIPEDIPQLPARAQHLREEFPSMRHHRIQSNMDDMLLSSSPDAQSTPRIRLEPSFERNGTTRLRNVSASSRSLFDPDSSSLGNPASMDFDTSSSHLLPTVGLNNHGKRESSPVPEQSSLGLEPRAQVIPRRKRAKQRPSSSKQDSKTLGDSCSQSTGFPGYGSSTGMRTMASAGTAGNGNISSMNHATQGYGRSASNHTLTSSGTSRGCSSYSMNTGAQGFGRPMSSYAMMDNGPIRNGNIHSLSTSSRSFEGPASNTDMLPKADYRADQSTGELSVSTTSNSRHIGGMLVRKDANAKISNAPFIMDTSGPSSVDRIMADSGIDELSREAEDHDVSRGFGRLQLGQPRSFSNDTSSRIKKPSALRPAGEHTSSNGNRICLPSRTDATVASGHDGSRSMMDIDELQTDRTALMNGSDMN